MLSHNPHTTMKLLATDDAVSRLMPALRTAKGRMTVADASAVTGMAIEDARTALEHAMHVYTCRLQVTESGEILYDFGRSLVRRGERTSREVLADILAAAWKLFTVLFKIWITVTLVVYFVLFVVIVIALLVASQGRDSKRIRLSWIGDLLGDLFVASSRTMAVVYSTDSYGYRHRAYRQTTRADHEKVEPKKRIVQSVYDFVFGPPRPNYDPFANEKEVLAWLRANRGLLTPTEIVALAGWTLDEAETRMADYLTRFRGDADITDEGVLVGRFRDVMMKGDAQLEEGTVELFWDEYEAPYEVTGNSKTRNAVIIGMNAFNLVMALVFTASASTREVLSVLSDGYASTGMIALVLGWVPLVFSSIFFVVPMVRAVRTRRIEAARLERNRRRRVLRVVYDMPDEGLPLAEVVAAVNRGPQVAMKEGEVRRILDALVLAHQGRTDLRDDGTVVYRFERIGHEARVVRALREREVVEGTGAVLFDSGE